MVLRVVLPPVLAAFAIFAAMAVVAWRRSVPRPRGLGDHLGTASLRHIVSEIVGGYVAFLAIVVIFHVWVAGDRAALVSAIGGGAFLCGVLVAVAAIWSLIQRRNLRQR
jgi:hypothetical protein